jgi:hypothetical protein
MDDRAFELFRRMSSMLCRIVVALGVFLSLAGPAHAVDLFSNGGPAGEIVILSGGPALREWENLRPEQVRHDRWWGNFVRAARIRMEQIRAEKGADALITWLVYRTGYELRSQEDKEDHMAKVLSVQEKLKCRLIWFRNTDEVIDYLNNGGQGVSRAAVKIAGFEYFGHSNKYCFTFDYSGEVLGASKVFLHQDDLKRLQPGIFARGARVQSWGCYTGEAMSAAFRSHTGIRMIGARGKTDYSNCWQGTLPQLSTSAGRWVR